MVGAQDYHEITTNRIISVNNVSTHTEAILFIALPKTRLSPPLSQLEAGSWKLEAGSWKLHKHTHMSQSAQKK
jgi:hypothetical protein